MDSVTAEKSFAFSIRIVNLYKYLKFTQKDYVISKQILRCGTSIGANVAEAQQAQSQADFVSKMNIALKEASETDYWLRLLRATEYIGYKEFKSLYSDCEELERLLVAIVKTASENLKK